MEPVGAALGHEPFFVGAEFLHVVLGAAFALELNRVEVAVFRALFEQNFRPAHLHDGISLTYPMRPVRNTALYLLVGLEHSRCKLVFNVLYFLLAQRDHRIEILT